MTKIEWTNETWNIITGCAKKSEGCQNCYAETMHKRLTAMGQEKYKIPFNGVIFHYDELSKKIAGKNKMVFVNSMSDSFNEKITGEQIDKILSACGSQPQHIFQILTKRAERVPGFSYPDNVWLGVTVEMAKYKNRIDYLRQTNAKVKFLSCEPLLEDLGDLDLTGISWVIVGGESGKNARPCHPQWVRNIQRQCKKQGVPFFFKQWGEWKPATDETTLGDLLNPKNKNAYCLLDGLYFRRLGKGCSGNELDGKKYEEYPATLSQQKTQPKSEQSVNPLIAMALAAQAENIQNGVVVLREDGKFNFEFMTDSEMCYLLEQLIEEINRRKAGTVDVGFWDKAGNYVEDRQPVQNAVVDLGITVHGGIKTADVTVEIEGKENE